LSYLVDTNVISELRLASPNAAVAAWFAACPPSRLYVSVLTLGEIRKGIDLLKDGPRKVALNDWLEIALPAYFNGRVLDIDAKVSDRWGKMLAAAGRAVPAIDSLIAATAVEHGLTLVTGNVKDVAALSVNTINPWLAP
jgi:predicted nucleic acid-binding protein